MKLLCLLLAVFFINTTLLFAQEPDGDQFKIAITELQAGHADKAIAALTELIRKNQKHADAYFLRGYLRMSAGDNSGALTDFNRTIELRPTMGQAYHERATLRLVGKDVKGAVQDLDAAIANNYRGDSVYSTRAQLRRDLGDTKGAVADLDEAIKLNPENPQYYVRRGSLLFAIEETERSLADLNHVLSWYEMDPWKKVQPNPNAPAKSTVPEKNESFTVGLATATVNPAPGDKEMVPFIAYAYATRGFIHSSRSDIDAAISDFTKSIRLDTSSTWVFYGRARAFESKMFWDAALADVNRAIQLEPMNGNLRVEHGVILTMMGKTTDAQIDFDMLLKADPKLWQQRIDERLAAVKHAVAP